MPAPLPQAPLNAAQRLACLRLIRSAHVGPATFRRLINDHGGAEPALAALQNLAHSPDGRALKLCDAASAERELEAAERAGLRPLFTIEPGFPAALAVLEGAPPLLYVRGNTELLNDPARPMVAMVGSRQASASGLQVAAQLSATLARAGVIIVSGLARGIDAVAHREALAHGTVAVMAGGADVIYPPEHADLHREIAARGCLVSEMPPGFKPRGKDFPRRNRIISGLALGVVIVEAARRSGTLITARYAGEQGREVFAIPGHPLDPRAEGTNHLLKQGATLITEAQDVLDVLRTMTGRWREPAAAPTPKSESGAWQPHRPTPAPSTARSATAQSTTAVPKAPSLPAPDTGSSTNQPPASANPLDLTPSPQPEHQPTPIARGNESDRRTNEVLTDPRGVVLAALGPAPVAIDALVRATGLESRTVQEILLELTIDGRIERHGAHLVSLKPP
ncbi:MAG: DNA-processing protein DprA [Pseudomonadota bacterium]